MFIIAVLFIGSSGTLLSPLDDELYAVLEENEFTGEIQKQLELKLGRKLDTRKVDLGRLIFFDNGLGLHQDNSCAGCHSPGFGFGDSQPIAIGVDNNNVVGIHREGPRNQRRTPSVINTAFYPSLMWNSRFASVSGDPFDNSDGFDFPPPEGDSLFNILYDYVQQLDHLLIAQAHLPFTELPEMVGFTSTAGLPIAFSGFSGLAQADENNDHKNAQPLLFLPVTGNGNQRSPMCPDPDFSQFDDGEGIPVPPVDPYYNSPNFGIRTVVLDLINSNPAYVKLFKKIYPEVSISPVNFIMVSEVVAEFEFSLTFAKAPLDKFATGNSHAMTDAEKRGALIFFGKGNCVTCHQVSGPSNEMFSDFNVHNVGTPQIFPEFGIETGNVPFSDINCPNKTPSGRLDFGREEVTGNSNDRYKFRSSPLRNARVQSSFFHNGSFSDLRDAIQFHLDPSENIDSYNPASNGVPPDLHYLASDMNDVMETLDPALASGIVLTNAELEDLYVFVRDALYDNRAAPEKLNALIPASVPSGVPVAQFETQGVGNQNVAGNETHPETIKDNKKTELHSLSALLASNPVYDKFSLTISGEKAADIRLIVTDLYGNVVETRNHLHSGEVIHFGQTYQRGLFFASLMQGEDQITYKLIKL